MDVPPKKVESDCIDKTERQKIHNTVKIILMGFKKTARDHRVKWEGKTNLCY